MKSALELDVWLLTGAVVQCVLILRSRRFKPHDWIVPLGILLAAPAAIFVYFTTFSTVQDAAKAFILGLGIGLTGAAAYVMEAAPARLNTTALLSLTVTFWAACDAGRPRPDWFLAAVMMSAAVALFALAPWRPPKAVRLALYVWSFAAAAAVVANGIPARAAHAVINASTAFPSPVTPLEAALTGAQYLLFMQLAVGMALILPVGVDKKGRSYADRLIASYDADSRLSWAGLAVILGQAAALVWARREGGEIQSRMTGLAVFTALAHGAMNGGDAAYAAPELDPQMKLRVSAEDRRVLGLARDSALAFLARRRWFIGLSLAATAILGLTMVRGGR
jgi:hypothetical protein